MLNLLPSEQKVYLEKEYKNRRFLVWGGLILCVLIVSLILLTPSYVLSRAKASEIKGELERAKTILDTELQPGDLTNQLNTAAQNARDLRPFGEKYSVYNLVKIFESKPSTIKINSVTFSVGEKEHDLPVISLAGTAVDRESLRSFGHLLETRPEFSAVDLPVSNFAQEKNISFNMSVTVK